MNNDLTAMMLSLQDSEHNREEILKPPFGYLGSKYRMVDKILPHLPYSNKYGEPFGGSGAVLLSRKVSPIEVFNDRHSGITTFYRCLQDKNKWELLKNRLTLILHSREEFIWSRDTWKDCTDEIERAARWYYSMEMSFSTKGENFARATQVAANIGRAFIGGVKRFPQIHNRLKHVQIENQDYKMLFKDFDSVDMVWYLDPPYLNVNGYAGFPFKEEEHVELLERIFKLRGFVAISGFNSDLYNKYPWNNKVSWEVMDLKAFAVTSTNNRTVKKDQQTITECLWLKEAE